QMAVFFPIHALLPSSDTVKRTEPNPGELPEEVEDLEPSGLRLQVCSSIIEEAVWRPQRPFSKGESESSKIGIVPIYNRPSSPYNSRWTFGVKADPGSEPDVIQQISPGNPDDDSRGDRMFPGDASGGIRKPTANLCQCLPPRRFCRENRRKTRERHPAGATGGGTPRFRTLGQGFGRPKPCRCLYLQRCRIRSM